MKKASFIGLKVHKGRDEMIRLIAIAAFAFSETVWGRNLITSGRVRCYLAMSDVIASAELQRLLGRDDAFH